MSQHGNARPTAFGPPSGHPQKRLTLPRTRSARTRQRQIAADSERGQRHDSATPCTPCTPTADEPGAPPRPSLVGKDSQDRENNDSGPAPPGRNDDAPRPLTFYL